MKRLITLLRRLMPALVIAAVAYFFTTTLQRHWHNLNDISISPNFYTVLATVLFAAAVIFSGLLWGWILERLSSKGVSSKDAMRIHAASWLLKYVPGQLGSILNKLAWGKKHGFTKKVITSSFIYENTLMVIAGALLSIPVIFMIGDASSSDMNILLPILAVIPMIVIFHSGLFNKILNVGVKLLGRRPFTDKDFLGTKDLTKALAMYLGPRLLNGIGFVVLAVSVTSVPASMYAGLASTYILAGIVGMLAIFVPSGVGVREGVIVLLLSQQLGAPEAMVLALLSRFYATIADAIVFVVYLILNKGKLQQL